MNTCTTKITY